VSANLTRGTATSLTRVFDLSKVTGTLAAANGGTGISSYAIGDMLYASASTTLSKLADVGAGSYLRSGGVTTAPLWSTLTLPNSATQGDLLTATGANAVGSVAAVAVGQVLTSAGTGTVPAYSANPSVTSATVKAGSSTGTLKAGGMLCSTLAGTCSCSTYSDASVQNQWNVITCTIPASALASVGDALEIEIGWKGAANANAKAIQFYWNGGTCSGTNAAMCTTGTQVFSIGTSTSGVSVGHRIRIEKSGSSTQNIFEMSTAATSVADTFTTTASVTDTNTIPIAWGIRNTAAAAASAQSPNPEITVRYLGQ
jgi:hypothetical protein